VKAFRRRVLAAGAVLFALALGIALGAGPLSGPAEVLPGLPNRTQSNAAVGSFESAFVDRTSADLLNGRLDGHAVVVLSVQGAEPDEVKSIRAALKEAGARITGTRTLTSKLLDPANRQFAEGVAKQAAGNVAGVTNGPDSYQRIGAALARALVNKSKGAPDAKAQTIWSAFEEGGFVSGDAPGTYADSAVVVVSGERSAAASTVLAGLARAIDAAAQGTVVAGPSSSSLVGGAVAEVRAAEGGSTVDVTESPAGSLLVALALNQDADGKPGAWGTPRSEDGALPAP
jgi:hypothetical protein